MRTRKKTAHSTSLDKISLTCPSKWNELSQEQLRYVLSLIGSNLYDSVAVKTLMFIRFCGINIIKQSANGCWSCWVEQDGEKIYFDMLVSQVRDLIVQLDYIERPEEMDVRLESIHGYQPVNGMLHNLPFIDYINLETAYQGYLQTRDERRVSAMARILYRDKDGNIPDSFELDPAEVIGTLFWYYYIKEQFSKFFPNFFKPVVGGSVPNGMQILESVNAQIRALTDGDITKENAVKQADCWRALTELDAKAREAAEFKSKYGNK